MKCLSKWPSSSNPPTPEKFLVAHLHSSVILFAKRSILNIWQCSEYVCFDNCSVICTVSLCNVLPQVRSEFWHIHQSVYSGICRHIQSYSALLRHIHAYWHNIKIYAGLLGISSTLCSVQNSPRQSANAKAFAETDPYFLVSASAKKIKNTEAIEFLGILKKYFPKIIIFFFFV